MRATAFALWVSLGAIATAQEPPAQSTPDGGAGEVLEAVAVELAQKLPSGWHRVITNVAARYSSPTSSGDPVVFVRTVGDRDALLRIGVRAEPTTEEAFDEEFRSRASPSELGLTPEEGARVTHDFNAALHKWTSIIDATGTTEPGTSFQVWLLRRGTVVAFDLYDPASKVTRNGAAATAYGAIEALMDAWFLSELDPSSIRTQERRSRFPSKTKPATWSNVGWRSTRWGMGREDVQAALKLSRDAFASFAAGAGEENEYFVLRASGPILGLETSTTFKFTRGRLTGAQVTPKGLPPDERSCEEWIGLLEEALSEKYGHATCGSEDGFHYCAWAHPTAWVGLKTLAPDLKDCNADISYSDPQAAAAEVKKRNAEAEARRRAELESL